MSTFNESNTIQAMLFDAAGHLGWTIMDQDVFEKAYNYVEQYY